MSVLWRGGRSRRDSVQRLVFGFPGPIPLILRRTLDNWAPCKVWTHILTIRNIICGYRNCRRPKEDFTGSVRGESEVTINVLPLMRISEPRTSCRNMVLAIKFHLSNAGSGCTHQKLVSGVGIRFLPTNLESTLIVFLSVEHRHHKLIKSTYHVHQPCCICRSSVRVRTASQMNTNIPRSMGGCFDFFHHHHRANLYRNVVPFL